MRGFGTIAANFSRNSVGSNRIARVPSLHGRRSRSTTAPSGASSSRSCAMGGRKTYRTRCSSRPRSPAGTATAACRSKPSRWACSGPRGADLRGVTVAPDTLHRPAGARPRGDPPDDRGALDLAHTSGSRRAARRTACSSPLGSSRSMPWRATSRTMRRRTAASRRATSRSRWRRQRHEAPPTLGILDEHALRGECVEMDVGIQRRPKPLDGRDGAADAAGNPAPRGAAPLEARARRERTRPAPHGRDDDPRPARSAAGTAASAPTGAPAGRRARRRPDAPPARPCAGRNTTGRSPALCTKRRPGSRAAVRAPKAREAARQDTARQELAELTLDKARQPVPAAAQPRLGQKGFEVLAHHVVQDRVLGPAADVGGAGAPITLPRGQAGG